MFADTASVGVGRTFVEFGSKIRTYEKLGLMTGGNVAGGEMVAKCLPDGCDYDHAAFVLPHALRKWLSVAHEQRVADPDVLILIAGWSEKMTRWAGAAVSTFDAPGREALIVRDCGVHLSPVMKAGGVGQLSDDETLANVLALGIDEFARRVLNARRLAEASTNGVCTPGGSGELVSISERGVVRRTIITWPDAVGDTTAAVAARVLAEPAPEFLPAAG